ncbi:MAG: DUF4860 domain-containing protein [Clostridia bacterium]|nr:DUF4860 domain-containing protein [Clostridia bacterium]
MRRIRTVSVDLLAALTLFCVYCGCVLFCLMTGASVYREANAAAETRFSARTTLSYLTARVRSVNSVGSLRCTQFGDGDALVLADPSEAPYVTYLYTCGGQLCELYTNPALGLSPEAGEVIVPCEDLRIWSEGNLLSIAIGNTEPIYIATVATAEVTP